MQEGKLMPKIYIDQGHNPVNPNAGAEGNGFREQDLVQRIGVLTANELRANGFDVRVSRPTIETQLGTSTATSLAARVNEANSWGADLFVSLHTNASELSTVSGTEGLIFRRGGDAERAAEAMVRQVSFATGLRNRGVTVRSNLYVLRRTRMPAVLLELGFITNPGDAELMAYSPGLFASGITNGILEYYGRL